MNIEKIKKDIIHHLNYVPEMSQSTYNDLKSALDIINAIEDIKTEIEEYREEVFHIPNTNYEGYSSVVHCLEIIDEHIEVNFEK